MTDVVQVSFHLDRAGRSPEALLAAWPTLPGSAIAAARAGVDVAVVQPAAHDALVLRDGVAFHFVRERPGLRRGPTGTRPVPRAAGSVSRTVRRLHPRLIHVQGLSLPGHAHRLKRGVPGTRLVAQDHADGLPRLWRRRRARRDLAALDGVFFTSAAQAGPFFEAGLFRSDLPVHEVLEASVPAEPYARTSCRGDRFIWLGRLDTNKDPLTVLAAFAVVAERLPHARLRMCWRGGALEKDVREQVHRSPLLRERVDLLGPRSRDEVRRLLCDADFLLQGSHREGSGYAVIEALACGVTPIVTSVPSLRRIVADTGFLWPPGDGAALIACLERAAASDRVGLEQRARQRFLEHLSWDAVGRQLARAYDAVLSAKTGLSQRRRSEPVA